MTFKNVIKKLGWKWKSIDKHLSVSFHACIAREIFGDYHSQTRLKIRQSVCKYVMENAINLSFFRDKVYCTKVKYVVTLYEFNRMIKEKETEHGAVDIVDLFAIAELYNVRIIVYEYRHDYYKKIVLSKDKCYVNCPDIPLIILSKIQRAKYIEWGIITDTHDISKEVKPMENLLDYKEIIEDHMHLMGISVQNVCNHWIKEFCPSEICGLITRFMPKLNVRPIGLPNENGKKWNQQMRNKRNEIMSYYD